MLFRSKAELIDRDKALAGREAPLEVPTAHFVNGRTIKPPFPRGLETAIFALGCFWGAERRFWELDGVYSTAALYAGGYTPNPTYEEVCSGATGHAEAVLVVYDSNAIAYETLLMNFWEAHDPTQGMRQGADVGTQYRSAIYTLDARQRELALKSRDAYQARLLDAGYGEITTEIIDAASFFYAEGYHQQYLAKNPDGYCGLGGTGVKCALGA